MRRVLFVLRHNLQNGHACLPEDKLWAAVSFFLGVEPETVTSMLAIMLENGDFGCGVPGKMRAVYLPEYMRAERNVAAHLRMLMSLSAPGEEQGDKLIDRIEAASGDSLCAASEGGDFGGAAQQCAGAHRRSRYR